MFRTCIVLSLLLATSACDRPDDYLPKQKLVAEKKALPQSEAVKLVRDIVGPCERAMERASESIGLIAVSSTPPAVSRHPVALAKTVCAGAFSRLQRSNASGEVRDACLAAAYARESVADTALDILEGHANAVAISTLQYKTADQAAASRACVAALSRAG